MPDEFSRTRLMLGEAGMQRLRESRVAVFGLGGVGGHVAEALARSGVGALDLIDNDTVSVTNLNRQILALHSTLGQYKVDVARARILDIHPAATVRTYRLFFTPQTAEEIDFSAYSYVVDAIDTVSGKVEIAVRATAAGVPVLSCMGAGNKLDPTAFEVTDLADTSVCPLARVMRRELRRRGIEHLRVVYSREPALTPLPDPEAAGEPGVRRSAPASNAFVPAVAGLIAAGEVIRTLAAGG